jgi:ketosteroid isomerase-like protein
MTTKSGPTTDEAQIRQRIESWTKAVRAKELDGLMSHYAQGVLVFDLAPPLQYKGAAAASSAWSPPTQSVTSAPECSSSWTTTRTPLAAW